MHECTKKYKNGQQKKLSLALSLSPSLCLSVPLPTPYLPKAAPDRSEGTKRPLGTAIPYVRQAMIVYGTKKTNSAPDENVEISRRPDSRKWNSCGTRRAEHGSTVETRGDETRREKRGRDGSGGQARVLRISVKRSGVRSGRLWPRASKRFGTLCFSHGYVPKFPQTFTHQVTVKLCCGKCILPDATYRAPILDRDKGREVWVSTRFSGCHLFVESQPPCRGATGKHSTTGPRGTRPTDGKERSLPGGWRCLRR